MDLSPSDAIEPLLAHYHARLLATPALCAHLDTLGVATAAMIHEHRLGFVDRTALRALLPRTAHAATAMRAAWRAAGFLLPNGREYLRSCIVVPLPGTSAAVGAPVRQLGRGVLAVRRGKGGTTPLVPLGRQARHWVDRYIETARVRHLTSAEEPALLLTRRGRRITAKMVTGRMRRCLQSAGITKAGSCHIFRHSVATLMHNRGADIRDLQALLAHALLTSTQLYTRVSMQRLLAVHARTHPAERAAGPDDPE